MNRFFLAGTIAAWLTLTAAGRTPAESKPAGPATPDTKPADSDLIGLTEAAMKAAVRRVAPSVVQIETSGGTEVVSGSEGPVRKGVGPTTGLVVSADGYVISSAFNFSNKPSAVFVTVPGRRERYPATQIATDHSRMLTLLKIDATGLPVPLVTPKAEMKVGQWALAIGRTWSNPDQSPSVSVGILAALGRIWGRAVQTDAKVSPVNYGGPLADVRGRVIGVLVPASPRAQDETAGTEWYDSGIGFAIPLEDVNAILPRLKAGKDLRRGLLGITLKSGDIYGATPVIETVAPRSAAAAAGIKPGDVVLDIDGVPVVRQAQILHQLGTRYEGDVITAKVKRGTDVLALTGVKLLGPQTAFPLAFLGVLPVRDDPDPGELIRFVYPDSPAAKAGLKPGDRLMKIGGEKGPLKKITGRDQLAALLSPVPPDTDIRLEVRRGAGDKTETLAVKLGEMPNVVPRDLPEPATAKKALQVKAPDGAEPAADLGGEDTNPDAEKPKSRKQPRRAKGDEKKDEKKVEPKKEGDKTDEPKTDEPKTDDKKAAKKAEVGLLKRADRAGEQKYWVFVPENYDPNITHAVVVWLHPPGKGKDRDLDDMVQNWQFDCEDHHIILVLPISENETGWVSSEADSVQEVVRRVVDEYTVDRARVVAHGMGVGGELAIYLGFQARDLIRAVAVTGTVFRGQPKENQPGQRLSFFVVAGGKDPLVKGIVAGKDRLAGQKFPVVYREIADMGHQYLDSRTLLELVRWVDSLDRQ